MVLKKISYQKVKNRSKMLNQKVRELNEKIQDPKYIFNDKDMLNALMDAWMKLDSCFSELHRTH